MKRICCMVLTVFMLLGLSACSGSNPGGSGGETAPVDGLQVGYSKVDFTPNYKVGLEGYFDSDFGASTEGV